METKALAMLQKMRMLVGGGARIVIIRLDDASDDLASIYRRRECFRVHVLVNSGRRSIAQAQKRTSNVAAAAVLEDNRRPE